MSLIFWTSYTATARGVRLKQVCCEKCGGYYYYEMIRAAQGKAAAIYNIDMSGAADRSARAANLKLAQTLMREQDPIPCPTCGHVQSKMPRSVPSGTARPAPGMPPSLVWVSRPRPDGSDGGHLATATPQHAQTGTSIVFQLPRVQLPAECCNCGKQGDGLLKTPFQIGDTPENLGLNVCESCRSALSSRAFIVAAIGWLLAIALGACVYLFATEEPRRGEQWAAVIAVTLVTGLVFNIVLPNVLVPPYGFTMLDAKRLIAKLRFRNASYAGLVAATVAAADSGGPLFADETSGQAAELANIVE
ncbi:hypothetical protein [Humisphaera borealis]|uniref:Uncharacterized protein n=1 Tax=Humisphaera borealis TaxID=2807512 RepID=A0A7M2WUQ1_9BACT|nr:hypothetical protein [Humisphaera borealis]QOV88902.1 hypothetical protein IPV69_22155 [Humisphaera borealis]